jgi:hypothetical protein
MQFQRCFAKCLLAMTVVASGGVAHAGLDGRTFDGYYALPNTGTPYAESTSSSPSFVVGAGAEATIDLEGVTNFVVDFSDASLNISFNTVLSNPTLNPLPFSGLVFNLVSPGSLGVIDAHVGAGTTLAGFGDSRISFSGGQIALDFAGLSYDDCSEVSIEFDTVSVVPEPATYALMVAGLGMIGFAARRRRA